MPAHARLALIQRLRQFADRQLALGEQRQRAQPGLLAGRPQRANDAARRRAAPEPAELEI